MDCLEFRNQYLAFVDQTLPPAEQSAAELHLASCSICARHDLAMRRGLMVLRNLPPVEPSPDFYDRLTTTLHRIEHAEARAARYRGPGLGSFAAVAAGVVGIGFMAAVAFNWTAQARNLALAPVVASTPADAPYPATSSSFVASASAGLPVWPAAMLVDQAPVRFASEELLGR
ncbi:MAG: anti-sigma factor family protein [Gemmatimonas sp.]|nr:zf-HC2 domain-containing protein [Gemmatimonadaceae bacterium]